MLGIDFSHHDAFEDARVAGAILLKAIAKSGITLEDWIAKSRAPIGGRIDRAGNPSGVLYGECLVFTGSLQITRREAAELAAHLGCEVAGGVTKRTSILVMGDQALGKFAVGQDKSLKHRKAEALIQDGYPLRIIGEADFMRLCGIEAQAGTSFDLITLTD